MRGGGEEKERERDGEKRFPMKESLLGGLQCQNHDLVLNLHLLLHKLCFLPSLPFYGKNIKSTCNYASVLLTGNCGCAEVW